MTVAMQHIGEIKPEENSELDQQTWIELIANHSALRKFPSRGGVNPFTKEPMTFFPPSTSAQVLLADECVGHITWAEDDSGLLNVSALPEYESKVSEIANEIARMLNCRFFLLPG